MQKIDWNKLWMEHRRQKTWQGKTREDWNKRAAGFARRNSSSPYISEFISRLQLSPEMTVLDVGSGPGTLSLPLSSKVKSVTAVDFSPEMLEVLQERCEKQNIGNIKIIEGAWEDDWDALAIGQHDLVIASRSLAVDDMKAALVKLNDKAKHAVVIGDRVGSGPFDPALFAAVGRRFVPGPDYIYTVNILYQMGILAQVDFIRVKQPKTYESRQAAIDSCAWMLDSLSAEEEIMLGKHFDERLQQNSDESWTLAGQKQPEWALISWQKREE